MGNSQLQPEATPGPRTPNRALHFGTPSPREGHGAFTPAPNGAETATPAPSGAINEETYGVAHPAERHEPGPWPETQGHNYPR